MGEYSAIGRAVEGLSRQFNINAANDLQREQLGMKRLEQTRSYMRQLDLDRQAKENAEFQKQMAVEQNKRAAEAHGWQKEQHESAIHGLKFKARRYKNAMQMTSVDINKFIGVSENVREVMKSKPELMSNIARIYGGESVNRNGVIVDKKGKPVIMTNFDQSMRGMDLFGVISAALDPAEIITHKQNRYNTEVEDLTRKLKALKGEPPGRAIKARAEYMRSLNKALANKQLVDSQATPMNLLASYKKKDQILRGLHAFGAANMADPQYLSSLSQSMAQNSKAMIDLQGELMKGPDADKYKGKQELIFKLTKDGLPDLQSARMMNISNTQGGMARTPNEIDSSIDPGYVFQSAYAARVSATKGDDGSTQKSRIDNYRRAIVNDIFREYGAHPEGQFFKKMSIRGKAEYASKYFTDITKQFPDADPLIVKNDAKEEADLKHNQILREIRQLQEKGLPDKKFRAARKILIDAWKKKIAADGFVPYNPIDEDY
jgi:hypothetical protein